MKETLIIVLFRGDFWCSSVIILSSDKYSSQFGGGSQYAYFHEEDETSFQLVDTAKTQKTAYQRNRMRFAQVRHTGCSPSTCMCQLILKSWVHFMFYLN